MKTAYKIIIVIISIAAATMSALPVMSVQLSGGESCTLFVRGYNLMEFSVWGCIPLFAPLLIPKILLGSQSRSTQDFEILCLLLGNILCYSHSFNAARTWLSANSSSHITYHSNALWYPAVFISILISGWFFVKFTISDAVLHVDKKVAEDV